MKKYYLKHFVPCTLLCLALICLTGCFDTKEEFTLNPDGSGKVVIESICAPVELQMNEKQTPEQKLQSAVRSLLDNVEGVTAWRDVTYERQDDGRVKFKGTAYFTDINKVVLRSLALMNFTLTKRADARLVLAAQMGEEHHEKPLPPKGPDPGMAAKIKEAKGNYQSSKPIMVGLFTTMKQDAIFHLPGAASEISNFKITPAGDLRLTFVGTNIIEAMDSLATNDDWWRLQLADGKDTSKEDLILDNDLNERLFGQRGPIRAIVAGGTPRFDYAREVAAAKTEYAALLRKLGPANTTEDNANDSAELAPPAQGGEFKSLKVGGIRWVFQSDDKNDVRPFSLSPGCTLSVIGELPGSVMAFSGGSLDTAIALDGSDLLPEQEWDRKINFPSLSRDHSVVVFDINLQAPGPEAKGFKEISGSLKYSVGTGSTNIDLGITEIRPGAQGSAFGAEIKSIKPGFGENGGQDLEIKLRIDPQTIISVKAIGTDGQEIPLGRRGYSGYNDEYTYTFNTKATLSPNARLIVQQYADVKKYSIPFKLANLTLLGQPLP